MTQLKPRTQRVRRIGIGAASTKRVLKIDPAMGEFMRRACLIGVLLTCFGWPITEVRGQSNISTNVTPKLQLTTEVIDARFCERDYLRLRLRLQYHNNGDQSIILYRQSNTVLTYFIFKSLHDADVEKYEQKYSPMQSSVGP